jgi:hypothetical protein
LAWETEVFKENLSQCHFFHSKSASKFTGSILCSVDIDSEDESSEEGTSEEEDSSEVEESSREESESQSSLSDVQELGEEKERMVLHKCNNMFKNSNRANAKAKGVT